MKKLRQPIKQERRGTLTRGVLLQHDNVKPHVSSKTVAPIRELGFECLHHPPYIPDLAPSNYWLFGEMKKIPSRKRISIFQRAGLPDKTVGKGTVKNSMQPGWKSCQSDGNGVYT